MIPLLISTSWILRHWLSKLPLKLRANIFRENRKREAESEIKKLTAEYNKDKRLLTNAEAGVLTPQALILKSFNVQMTVCGVLSCPSKLPRKQEASRRKYRRKLKPTF